MKHLKPYIYPFVLFVLSFILRLSLISKGPYHIDTLSLMLGAERLLETGHLQYEFGPGYPLTTLLSAAFILITRLLGINDAVFAINLTSVVFGSLCVPLVYLIGKRLFNSLAGALAATLFSLSPIFLGISVYGKSHAPSLFFLLAAVLFLLKYQESYRLMHLYLAGIAAGLLGAARLQELALMIIPFAYLYFVGAKQEAPSVPPLPLTKRMTHFIHAGLLALGTALLFHLPFLFQGEFSGFQHQLSTFWHQGLTNNFRGFFSNSLVRSSNFLVRNFTQIGYITIIIGFCWLIKISWRLSGFLLLWVVVPLAFYGNLYSTVPRFFTPFLPALYLVLGFTLAKLYRFNRLFKGSVLFILVCILELSALTVLPSLSLRHKYALLPDYARWVGQVTEDNARIIVTDEGKFISYYGKRTPFGRPASAIGLKEEDMIEFREKLDSLLAQHIPVYITDLAIFSYNPHEEFSQLIVENYNTELIGQKAYESWHTDVLEPLLFPNALYKLSPLPR
ncbi:MAG: glycosyltransferase family 39 protein [Candidatus Omnitrophota bacterium]|nr:glycosyltransferase family 39 protein [Candidatus Omnitrophota bacterium]